MDSEAAGAGRASYGTEAWDRSVRSRVAPPGGPVLLPKGLVDQMPSLGRVPRYVAEFLLAQEEDPEAALARVADYVAERSPSARDGALWMHRLIREGVIEILDELSVAVDVTAGRYLAHFASLHLPALEVDASLVDRFPMLVTGGMWGRIQIVRAGSNPNLLSGEAAAAASERRDGPGSGSGPCQTGPETASFASAAGEAPPESMPMVRLAGSGWSDDASQGAEDPSMDESLFLALHEEEEGEGEGEEEDGYWQPVLRLDKFVPVQVQAELASFLDARRRFNVREWMDLLLASAGYDPAVLTEDLTDEAERTRRKLLFLARLTPLVEPSVHLLELGPRNTGKTFLLRSVSPQVFVLSGSRATPSTLFYNLQSKVPGILAARDVVVFDEVSRLHLGGSESVGILKDVLEAGHFSRGWYDVRTEVSTLFLGNIDVDRGLPSRRYRTMVDPLPDELRDTAFLDRLHGYIPGWEFPKLRPDSFARSVGFVSDYFGECLRLLRRHPYESAFRTWLAGYPLLPGMTQRDRTAVERVARGLFKILFPHGELGPDRVVGEAVLSLAGELRQRVHDQLAQLAPGEFQPRRIGFAGVPVHEMPDFMKTNQGPGLAYVMASSGEAGYLDAGAEGMDGVGEVRPVEVSFTGRTGLTVVGSPKPATVQVLRTAYEFVRTHVTVLGLPHGWLDERGLAVQVVGDLRDPEGLALAAALAMATAVRKTRPVAPIVACGATTLHGRLSPPVDLAARVRVLAGAADAWLILPSDRDARNSLSRAGLPLPSGSVLWVDSLEDALRRI